MTRNQVAHFEIYADNAERLGGFYKSLFNWDLQPMQGMDYTWVKTTPTDDKGMPTEPGGINGGMLKRPAGYNTRAWINYVNVESLDDSLRKAQGLGAKVLKGKSAVPNMGWYAIVTDPEGNEFGLWQSDHSAR